MYLCPQIIKTKQDMEVVSDAERRGYIQSQQVRANLAQKAFYVNRLTAVKRFARPIILAFMPVRICKYVRAGLQRWIGTADRRCISIADRGCISIVDRR